MTVSTALLFAFAANALAWAGCAFYVFGVKKIPFYHPLVVFLLYFLLGYVYRPIADWYFGGAKLWNDAGFWPTPENIFYTTLVDLVGMLSFVFVPIFLVGGLHDRLAMPKFSLAITRVTGFYIAAAVVAVIAVVSLSRTISASSSQLIGIFTRVTADGGFASENGSGYETIGIQFLPALLMILYLRFGLTWFNVAVTAAYMFVRMYMGSERSGFITVVLAALVVYMIRSGMRFVRVRHVVIALLLLVTLDFIGNDRFVVRHLLTGETNATAAIQDFQHRRVNDAPFADVEEFESMSLIVTIIPDMSQGYNWFTQYATLLVRPIPRQWWPDKPTNTGRIVMARHRGFFDLTFSMMGDAYSNFGLLSVMFMMILDSTLLCGLYKLAQRTNSPHILFLLVVVTANLPLLYRDGGWPGSLYFVLSGMIGASILIWGGGIRVVRRPADTAGRPAATPRRRPMPAIAWRRA